MAFVGAAIGAIVSGVGAAFAAGGFFTTFVGRVLLSVALSALQSALVKKPREPGIKTKVTQTGGINPLSFPLLRYATAGTHVCPPMTHGRAGKTPNAFLTYVIAVSAVPGVTLSRLMINDAWATIGTTPHPDYGLPILEDIGGGTWIRFYDGTQTAADPMLLNRYGAYPERPWSADMVGRGVAYAILTFQYNRERYPGMPRVKFELNGVPLYDPRRDTTVGGAGAHRWANRATWEPTLNPIVAAYNVKRGIALLDGSTWGGGFPAEDLPLATWFAGMNECDLLVSNGVGTEPQFRAGLEVSVDEEPADVLAELLTAASAQVAETGGQWKLRVGPPGLPAFALTDADVVITKDRNFRPFPGFAASHNAVHATYPDPDALWEPKEAPPLYTPALEAEDQGQRLVAELNLTAVPFAAQVRRLMDAWLKEERRFRRHELTLPPDYAQLEPLDALAWTSPANGYAAKGFEASGVTEDPMTGLQRVILRERDAGDFTYPVLPAPPPISTLPVIPPDQTVPNFAVSGTSIPDATGAARRPALQLSWEPDLDDVAAILWEVRVQATGVIVARGQAADVAAGSVLVAEGIVASTAYEARALPVVDRPAAWTAWAPATTPATLLLRGDLAVGAASDRFTLYVPGPFVVSSTPVGHVFFTYTHGPILPHQVWRRSTAVEMRNNTASNSPAMQIKVQVRRKPWGLPYSPWNDVWVEDAVHTSDFGSGQFVPHSETGQISQPLEDIQYRLIVSNVHSTGPGIFPPTTFQWIREIRFTFFENVR